MQTSHAPNPFPSRGGHNLAQALLAAGPSAWTFEECPDPTPIKRFYIPDGSELHPRLLSALLQILAPLGGSVVIDPESTHRAAGLQVPWETFDQQLRGVLAIDGGLGGYSAIPPTAVIDSMAPAAIQTLAQQLIYSGGPMLWCPHYYSLELRGAVSDSEAQAFQKLAAEKGAWASVDPRRGWEYLENIALQQAALGINYLAGLIVGEPAGSTLITLSAAAYAGWMAPESSKLGRPVEQLSMRPEVLQQAELYLKTRARWEFRPSRGPADLAFFSGSLAELNAKFKLHLIEDGEEEDRLCLKLDRLVWRTPNDCNSHDFAGAFPRACVRLLEQRGLCGVLMPRFVYSCTESHVHWEACEILLPVKPNKFYLGQFSNL
ncbi:MAG: hypothetical protein K1X83_12570 [Oligoflexia bacterium]|nr:hypothetical protein [Oligoflexia bacterium]